jgi:hypothetical protein
MLLLAPGTIGAATRWSGPTAARRAALVAGAAMLVAWGLFFPGVICVPTQTLGG